MELYIVFNSLIFFDKMLLVIEVFDCEEFGICLCFMFGVLIGVWEKFIEGCVNLVIGVILDGLEVVCISGCFQMQELGVVDWVFVVLLMYLLVFVIELLLVELVCSYWVIVVGDNSQFLFILIMGLLFGQEMLIVVIVVDKL